MRWLKRLRNADAHLARRFSQSGRQYRRLGKRLSLEQLENRRVLNGISVTTESLLLNWDAATESSNDDLWQDTTGVSGFDWELASGVQWVDPITTRGGIKGAFDFVDNVGGVMSSLYSVNSTVVSRSDASWEFWIKPTAGTDRDIVFETGGSQDGTSLVYDGSTGKVTFKIRQRADEYRKLEITSKAAISTEEFTQVVAIYDGGDNYDTLSLYINGVPVIPDETDIWSDDDVDAWAGSDGSGLARIGGSTANVIGDVTRYEGQIAIVRFYNRALSSAEVEDNYVVIANIPPVATDDVYSTAEDAVLTVAAPGILGNDFDIDPRPTPRSEVNLVADCDEDPDTTWENMGTAGSGYDLSLSGAVTRRPVTDSLRTGIRAAYDFSGGQGWMKSLDNLSGANDSASFEIWFRPDSLIGGRQVLFETGGNTGSSFALIGNILYWRVKKTDTYVAETTWDITGLETDFIQAVGTFDTATGKMKLFVNGDSVDSHATYGLNDWSGPNAAGVAYIGGGNMGGWANPPAPGADFGHFMGQIAILRVYQNQLLSSNEVAANYDAIASGMSAEVVSGPSHGTLSLNPDGGFTYTPGIACAAASDSFQYQVFDGIAYSDPATVTINLTPAVPDGAVTFEDGIVRIGGTAGPDTIVVAPAADPQFVQVMINDLPVGGDIPLAEIAEIRAWGRDGDDQIALVDLALLSLLYGGRGADHLTGGAGDNFMFGGEGDDHLIGAAGNDMLIGGSGVDRIVGSAGHDVLVSGDLDPATTDAVLRAMLAGWVASHANSVTVLDNDFADLGTGDGCDLLTGGSGSDWFIVDGSFRITDIRSASKHGDRITWA